MAIGFIVCACESGRGARWGNQYASSDVLAGDAPDAWDVIGWTRSIVAQCRAAGMPCLVKQLPTWSDSYLHGGLHQCKGRWIVSSDPADFPQDLKKEIT